MTPARAGPIGVLCVDDNPHVAEALRLKFERAERFEWKGWLPRADALLETAQREKPGVVLLDLDMPGADPLDATERMLRTLPDIRVVVFSGHVRAEFIERALRVGAWGYVSKNDGEDELLRVLGAVWDGNVEFSPEARTVFER